MIGAGVGPLWQRWREDQAAAAVMVRRSVRGTFAETDLRTLRVHPTVIDVPYLHRRAKEQEVRERLRAGRPVLLVGSSMVGKTRLAAAVVCDLYPDWFLVMPDTTTALADLDEADLLQGNHVIWLDDLDRYLSGGGLTAGLILRLAERNAVVATLRARVWDRLQPTDQLRPPEWDVLSVFEKVTLDRDRDRPSDEDLTRAVPDLKVRERIIRIGIGEYVGAGERITDRLTLGAQSHPLGYALVHGAVDWRRTGVTRPVPASLLRALAAERLTPRQRTALDNDESYADALTWATQEINPTVALLEPGDGCFTVYDFALDRLTDTDDAPPAATWQLAIDNAEPCELVAVGYQAITYGYDDVAEGAYRRAAKAGDSGAMFLLGGLFLMRGDLTESEAWFRRADEAANSGAMIGLGILLAVRGERTEAQSWLRRADGAAHSEAMTSLHPLLQERGDPTAAEAWYRQGAEAGHSLAMASLGTLLRARGALPEAEIWYRRGAEDGHNGAMTGLAELLKERGDLTEAEAWFRRAAENGHAEAMTHLGILFAMRGELTEAEAWFRRAVEGSHTEVT